MVIKCSETQFMNLKVVYKFLGVWLYSWASSG